MKTIAFAFWVALAGSFVWWLAQPLVRGIDRNQERGEEE